MHTPDQDYTDFTKAIMELYKYCQEHKTEVILLVKSDALIIDNIYNDGNLVDLHLYKYLQIFFNCLF